MVVFFVGGILALRATKVERGGTSKGLVGNPRGCCDAVTRVSWTAHDNMLNNGI